MRSYCVALATIRGYKHLNSISAPARKDVAAAPTQNKPNLSLCSSFLLTSILFNTTLYLHGGQIRKDYYTE